MASTKSLSPCANHRLESPCLGRIHGDPLTPQQPNGHALAISAYVLSSSSSLSLSLLSPEAESPPDGKNRSLVRGVESAPRSILDRLLALSTTFALEDELTPVPAWERIWEHMEKWGVESYQSSGQVQRVGEEVGKLG